MQFVKLSNILDAHHGEIVTSNHGKNRIRARRAIMAGLGASLFLGSPPPPAKAASPTFDLISNWKQGDAQRVSASLDVNGLLRMNADGKKVTTTALTVKGRFSCEERLLSASPQRTARSYDIARANISIGAGSVGPKLRSERRQIIVHDEAASVALRSVAGPLTREELDLVNIQGNSALIEKLLPTGSVAMGDSWSPADALWAKLLVIDAVSQNDIKATLKTVDKNTAYVQLAGALVGAVGGVSTEIELEGGYTFSRKQSRITELDWTIKEDRAIAHAEPGLKVTAQLKVRISPLAAPRLLPDAFVQAIPQEASEQDLALEFRSQQGGFLILLDRRWRVMLDRPDATVMRLVDRGDLIAQCNISRLPDQTSKPISLEKFQSDIQAGLGKQTVTFQEAVQTTTPSGLRLLRVFATGKISDLAIQWRYFHLSNAKGESASYVITVEENLLARLGNVDQVLTNAFAFQKRQAVAARSKKKSSQR